MRRALGIVAALSVLLFGAGCVEDLDPASLVKSTRPIGARVSVEGDPALATPAPGQTGRIEFLVAIPDELPPLSWGFVLCPGLTAPTGDAICAGDPFAFSLQEEPVEEVPALDFTLPEGFEAEQMVGLGVICADAAPVLDPMAMELGCEEGGTETLLRFTVEVLGPEDEANHNPGLPGAVTFDGEVWEPADDEVPLEGCADAGVPTVSAGADDVVIDFDTAAFVRDEYIRFDGEAVSEDIVVSHFATAGEFERLLSIVDDIDPDVEVDWTPPPEDEAPAAGGERVRFWFVFRDQRGGVSWIMRDACAVP